MSLHKNCGCWKNSDCIFEFSVKSYVTNTINLSCAKILLPSVNFPSYKTFTILFTCIWFHKLTFTIASYCDVFHSDALSQKIAGKHRHVCPSALDGFAINLTFQSFFSFSKIRRQISSFVEICHAWRIIYRKTPNAFMIISSWFPLRMKNFSEKIFTENKKKKHFVFSNLFFFPFTKIVPFMR